MHYKIVVHSEPEGGFWAEVPVLPGCCSEGETMDELKANVQEAIQGYLEVLAEEGRQPEPDVQILEMSV